MRQAMLPTTSAACFAVFAGLWGLLADRSPPPEVAANARVVISAPVQILLTGGDRLLAADLEAIRLAATGGAEVVADTDDATYRLRGHHVVAQLNPCHEDNYYVGNALLSWGGAPDEGNELLKRASDCRTWDEYPPFFYGFNEWFFNRNPDAAQKAFNIAAERATENAATFRRIAILIEADKYNDERAALNYLRGQQDGASDPRLRDMLGQRVARLEGLLVLRDAQRRYEELFGKPLTSPSGLIEAGVLAAFPPDPLKIGYTFENGKFNLRKLKIAGMERLQ